MTVAPCRSHVLGGGPTLLAGWMGCRRVRKVQRPRRKHPLHFRRCRPQPSPAKICFTHVPPAASDDDKAHRICCTPVRARTPPVPPPSATAGIGWWNGRRSYAMASWPSSPQGRRDPAATQARKSGDSVSRCQLMVTVVRTLPASGAAAPPAWTGTAARAGAGQRASRAGERHIPTTNEPPPAARSIRTCGCALGRRRC